MIGGEAMDRVINEQHGFIRAEDVPALAEVAPDMMVIARCGGGRYTCRMDQVPGVVAMVDADPNDYLRDVCLTADNFQRVEQNEKYIPAEGIVRH